MLSIGPLVELQRAQPWAEEFVFAAVEDSMTVTYQGEEAGERPAEMNLTH